MDGQSQNTRGYGFMAGVLTGACVGVGLALWLAPRAASELRHRAITSARDLGQEASDQLDLASSAVGQVRDEIVKRGRGVRDDLISHVADAVVNGAGEVSRFAAAAKSDGHTGRGTA